MTTNQNQLSSKISTGKTSKSGWIVGGMLVIAAALAISFAIRSAPAKPAVQPASHAQSVPDAAVQSVAAYIQAHQGSPADTVQAVPDAAAQSVAAYLAAHGPAAQAVPDANTQSVLAYLAAHGAGPSASGQTMPDANTQSVAEYIQAHQGSAMDEAQLAHDTAAHDGAGFVVAHGAGQATVQIVPDAATQGVLAYLRAHGAHVPSW